MGGRIKAWAKGDVGTFLGIPLDSKTGEVCALGGDKRGRVVGIIVVGSERRTQSGRFTMLRDGSLD